MSDDWELLAQFGLDWAALDHFRELNRALTGPALNEHRVVLIGDSITEGWRYTATTNPGEMGQYFRDQPYINRGISGQTTAQILLRFRQDVIELHPASVVILAGINDLSNDVRVTVVHDIESNLATMAELANAHNIRVVLASITPVAEYPWSPTLQPTPRIVAINEWLREYCVANQHTYLDYFAKLATPTGALRPEYSEDGVHLNNAGYAAIVESLETAIRDALARRKP